MNGTDGTGLLAGEVVASVGAVLTVVGSVLPWVSTQPATLGGAPSGPVTALVAMGVVLVALFRRWSLIDKVVVGALGVVALVVAANAMMTLGTSSGVVSPGIGLYLVLVGGVIVVLGAGIGLVSGTRRGLTGAPRRS